jgi:hypothetical protein
MGLTYTSTKQITMKQIHFIALFLFFTTVLLSCKKAEDEKKDPNDVGGEPVMDLTQVGRKSLLDLRIAGRHVGGEMYVKSNTNGLIVYHVQLDLTGHPDSLFISALIPDVYKNSNGVIETDFKMKITSEGIVDYFVEGKPRLLVKYGDGVGTEYKFNATSGYVYVRRITEKTGLDEWPLTPWFYIKTSKIEENVPSNPYNISKITYRANHRFGLVFLEGTTPAGPIRIDVYPTGM